MKQVVKISLVIISILIAFAMSSCGIKSSSLHFDTTSNEVNDVFKTEETKDFANQCCDYFNMAVALENSIVADNHSKHLDEYNSYPQMEDLSKKLIQQIDINKDLTANKYKSELVLYVTGIQYDFSTIDINIPIDSGSVKLSGGNEDKIKSSLSDIDKQLLEAYNYLRSAKKPDDK